MTFTCFPIGAIIAAVFLFSAAQDSDAPIAPPFKVKTLNGPTIEGVKLKGKVVVLNVWATWCGPCRSEIPDFLQVYKETRDKGLGALPVSGNELRFVPIRR